MWSIRKWGFGIPLLSSIRFRLFALIVLFTVVTVSLLEVYTLYQFQKATTLEIEHEALLVSDTLKSIIAPLMEEEDFPEIQAHIDRLVSIREKNDIEMNVLIQAEEGDSSEIVASNIRDNIEVADDEEHADLFNALRGDQPIILIDRDDEDLIYKPDHPDYYLAGGQRILSMTTPLVAGGIRGGINVKLSLGPLDEGLNTIRWAMIGAALAGAIIIIIIAGILLNRQVFFPLRKVRETMAHIASGDLTRQVTVERLDEIGVLAQDFNSMARQLARTQSQLHQYLNPMAIAEAYRRAGEKTEKATAEEKVITVLFVDIVSFTTIAENFNPNQTVAFLNHYYDLVTVALVDSGGYIDKYVADEVVCIFDNTGHPTRAVEAALKILQLLNELGKKGEQVQARIGINTGECIIADVGSIAGGMLDRTIIGDTVNIAQRLMRKAVPNGAVLSQTTYATLKQKNLNLTSLGEQQLKGKSKSVMAYQLLG